MTRRRTRTISTWGRWGRHAPLGDIHVRPHAWETVHEAVVRSLRRRLGLACYSGPRWDGDVADRHGHAVATHWQVTLGRPVSRKHGGGFNPEVEVWFAVPREERA